jgi:hypothetical protein
MSRPFNDLFGALLGRLIIGGKKFDAELASRI